MATGTALTLPEFPRTNRYDPQWLIAGCMGPNPLWLLEDLAADLRLEPGMRVLDLGCGRARTSVFLAREYGVTVWAADLWIPPTENLRHVSEAGVADRVFPLHTEAHDLPFAEGYFDAVVSVDAYQYFGTDDLYIGYLRKFVAPGGQIGIAVPALVTEPDGVTEPDETTEPDEVTEPDGVTELDEVTEPDEVPEHLRPYWEWDFACFHSAHWWRRHWARTGQVEVTAARAQPQGWRHWRLWSEVCARESDSDFVRRMSEEVVAMLTADQGRTLTFAMVVGQVAGARRVTS